MCLAINILIEYPLRVWAAGTKVNRNRNHTAPYTLCLGVRKFVLRAPSERQERQMWRISSGKTHLHVSFLLRLSCVQVEYRGMGRIHFVLEFLMLVELLGVSNAIYTFICVAEGNADVVCLGRPSVIAKKCLLLAHVPVPYNMLPPDMDEKVMAFN